MASGLKSHKAFFQWLPSVSYVHGLNRGILMETSNPSLKKLHNDNCLVNCPSHSLDDNVIRCVVLEQGERVGDVVAGAALRGDADLVGADGGLLPRLLHPLVPIHRLRRLLLLALLPLLLLLLLDEQVRARRRNLDSPSLVLRVAGAGAGALKSRPR